MVYRSIKHLFIHENQTWQIRRSHGTKIRSNTIAFSREWVTESREDAEAKTFWYEFFRVFGIQRKKLAVFEEPVKKLSGKYGFRARLLA